MQLSGCSPIAQTIAYLRIITHTSYTECVLHTEKSALLDLFRCRSKLDTFFWYNFVVSIYAAYLLTTAFCLAAAAASHPFWTENVREERESERALRLVSAYRQAKRTSCRTIFIKQFTNYFKQFNENSFFEKKLLFFWRERKKIGNKSSSSFQIWSFLVQQPVCATVRFVGLLGDRHRLESTPPSSGWK